MSVESASGRRGVTGMSILRDGMRKLVRWLATKRGAWRSRGPRQLCLRETLALGERRFVAVVEFEQQRFLIGGTGSSLSMLASLASSAAPEAAAEGVPTGDFKTGSELRRAAAGKARFE